MVSTLFHGIITSNEFEFAASRHYAYDMRKSNFPDFHGIFLYFPDSSQNLKFPWPSTNSLTFSWPWISLTFPWPVATLCNLAQHGPPRTLWLIWHKKFTQAKSSDLFRTQSINSGQNSDGFGTKHSLRPNNVINLPHKTITLATYWLVWLSKDSHTLNNVINLL